MTKPKIILPGGSGFLGRILAPWFAARGWEVVILSRGTAIPDTNADTGSDRNTRVVEWDGERMGPWAAELEGATALINLAGRSVNCRYHARNRRAMMDSRILSTRVLGEAVRGRAAPPRVWFNSSTATIYKHTYGDPHAENGEIGATPEAKDAFSIEVATAWEREFERIETPATRKALLRTAMVFGNGGGGVYDVLRRLARFGLGGKMAHGRQWVSWIHAEDFCRAIEWMIGNETASGIFNLAAPNPVTNREMMEIVRRQFGVPIGLPAARWMLEVGAIFLRTETELIIKSRRVVPARLLREKFAFLHPRMEEAVANLEQTRERV